VGLYALDHQAGAIAAVPSAFDALTSEQIEQVIHHYLTLQPLSSAVIEA